MSDTLQTQTVGYLKERLADLEELLSLRNRALREMAAERDGLASALHRTEDELRDFQQIAVELGAYATVAKDKSRNVLTLSVWVDAGLLAAARDRKKMLAAITTHQVYQPLVAEAERAFGRQPEPRRLVIGEFAAARTPDHTP